MNINELADQWQQYKVIEQTAAANRKAIEQQMQELIDIKLEGSTYRGNRPLWDQGCW